MCATDDDFVLVQSVLAIPLIFCNRVFGVNFVHTLATICSIENCDSFFLSFFLRLPQPRFWQRLRRLHYEWTAKFCLGVHLFDFCWIVALPFSFHLADSIKCEIQKTKRMDQAVWLSFFILLLVPVPICVSACSSWYFLVRQPYISW